MGTLFEEIPQKHRAECLSWAKLAINDNPKLVKAYFEGKGGNLAALTDYATGKGAELDERWIAEYIVVELDRIRKERWGITDEKPKASKKVARK